MKKLPEIWQKRVRLWHKRPKIKLPEKRILLLCGAVWLVTFVTVAIILQGIPVGWIIFGYGKAFYTASLDGERVGGMGKAEIESVVADLGDKLNDRKIILAKDGDKWLIPLSDLGIRFDEEETLARVAAVSDLNLHKRLFLFFDKLSLTLSVDPAFAVDAEKCRDAIGVLKIPAEKPKNASIVYDGSVKIKESINGETVNPRLTCEAIFSYVSRGVFSAAVVTDPVEPRIASRHYEKILSKVKKITSETLTLTYGKRYWKVKPKELFSYLRFKFDKKTDSIKVTWSQAWLNAYAAAVAKVTDSANAAPKLGTCEYLVSRGGYALNKKALKSVFKNLHKKDKRRYELKVDYARPYVKKMLPVKSGNKGTVYLTFDDGMSCGASIMRTAACYGVKVTFFIIGSRADADASGMVAAIAAGHAVQSHGWEHDAFSYGEHSYDWQYNDIKNSIAVIQSITGVRPTFFRPPGGNCSSATHAAASANGLTLILWGATAADTSTTSPSQICQNVLNATQAGDSILAHGTKSATAAALPCIIEGLAKRGFTMKALR